MLHYKSPLLQTLSTFFYSFPLLLGWSEQRQHLSVTMMEYQEPFVSAVLGYLLFFFNVMLMFL